MTTAPLHGPIPEGDLVSPASFARLSGRRPFAVRGMILGGDLPTVRRRGRLFILATALGHPTTATRIIHDGGDPP